MGQLDQFIKELFSDETPKATQDSLHFEVPAETPTTEVMADGLLSVVAPERVSGLWAPWSLMRADEQVFEFKMQGDKLGPYEFERALLRRQARQCWRLKKWDIDPKKKLPLWIITGHVREWLRERHWVGEVKDASGVVVPGCYRLEPRFEEIYLLVSNELPLQEELIPFLVTRTGPKLIEFCRWFAGVRPEPCETFIEMVPMSENLYDEIYQDLKEPDDAERLRRRKMYLEATAISTGYKDELQAEGLRRLFSRKLGRALTGEEGTALAQKLSRLGVERLEQVVLDLSSEALLSWLPDPNAV